MEKDKAIPTIPILLFNPIIIPFALMILTSTVTPRTPISTTPNKRRGDFHKLNGTHVAKIGSLTIN